MIILEAGGLGGGGINFDAKTRRNSTDLNDIVYAHIGGMDAFARALLIAEEILTNSEYTTLLSRRYASFDKGKGRDFVKGKLSLTDLAALAVRHREPEYISGRQEYLENLISRFL